MRVRDFLKIFYFLIISLLKILINFLVKNVIQKTRVKFDAFSRRNGLFFLLKKRRLEAKVLNKNSANFKLKFIKSKNWFHYVILNG